MRNIERIREALAAVPGADYFRQRAVAGWRPVAIVWERDIDAPPEHEVPREDIPYGLQVSADCSSLEESPTEMAIIRDIIEGVVRDHGMGRIAAAVNAKGHRTRQGEPWTAKDIFELMPRLIEVGARLFPTGEWAERRNAIFRAG
jgi:hypothetical protein